MQVTFTGANPGAQITAACFNLPAGASCSLSGNTVTITTSASAPTGSYQVIVVFTASQQVTASLSGQQPMLFAAAVGFLGLPVGLVWARRNRKKMGQRVVLIFTGIVLLAAVAGCGGRPKSITTTTTQQVSSQSSLAVTLNVN